MYKELGGVDFKVSKERICGRFLKETGRIDYYVIKKNAGYAFMIEQERGVLFTAETEMVTKNYAEALSLIKSFAEQGVTATMLKDICQDLLWIKRQNEQKGIKNA
ncbi:MAG: hypothetical protein IKJ06_00465 [Clostridia bacterium]|nr:hypothetical protein [Clostridia bacterium]